ncbi:hypothetical protein NG799_28660 [Laspinema sp. D1]|uniref:Uncharacterized protein n=1 Tax=Laspinema palackyanum D2a TaxID=2953684 RepID=A0ABT2N060_9CYAN|nr:hypothetical protein [Laspinema sp. D2a]
MPQVKGDRPGSKGRFHANQDRGPLTHRHDFGRFPPTTGVGFLECSREGDTATGKPTGFF